MERRILNEELNMMKYLVSYKRGVIISEQTDIDSEESGMGSMSKEKIQSIFEKEVVNDSSLGEVASNVPSVDDVVSNDQVCDIVTGNEEHDNIISKVRSELLRIKKEKGSNGGGMFSGIVIVLLTTLEYVVVLATIFAPFAPLI